MFYTMCKWYIPHGLIMRGIIFPLIVDSFLNVRIFLLLPASLATYRNFDKRK